MQEAGAQGHAGEFVAGGVYTFDLYICIVRNRAFKGE